MKKLIIPIIVVAAVVVAAVYYRQMKEKAEYDAAPQTSDTSASINQDLNNIQINDVDSQFQSIDKDANSL